MPMDMKLMQSIARLAEPDALTAAGRKVVGMASDPTSQLKRFLGRMLMRDGVFYDVNHFATMPGKKREFADALRRAGDSYNQRLGYLKNTGLAAGAVGAGAVGAGSIGVPKGVDMAKERLGQAAETGLPQVPLADRLGFALKSIFAPASAGKDINNLLNR